MLRSLVTVTTLGSILVLGIITPVYAADLSAELSSSGIAAKPQFKFLETAFIEYPDGGQLKDLLQGQNKTISFVEDSTNPSVKELIRQLTTNLVREQKSIVSITDLTVQYTASLSGNDKYASIDYKIVLVPTITNYEVKGGSVDDQSIIDTSWMGVSINGPVIIKTAQFGDVDINTPSSFLQKVIPDVYSKITEVKADGILKNSLIDASPILQQPFDSWNHLFDPAYKISETSQWGYNGTKIAITTYTMGESNIIKSLSATIHRIDFTIDKNYDIQTVQQASSATIQIDGYVTTVNIGNETYFSTTPKPQLIPATGFPVGIIYGMAGFGVIVTIGVLIWSDKKIKAKRNE